MLSGEPTGEELGELPSNATRPEGEGEPIPDYGHRREPNWYVDAGVMTVVALEDLHLWRVLERHVWRSADKGAPHWRAMRKAGLLVAWVDQEQLCSETGVKTAPAMSRKTARLQDHYRWIRKEKHGKQVGYVLGFVEGKREHLYFDVWMEELWSALAAAARARGEERVLDLPWPQREAVVRRHIVDQADRPFPVARAESALTPREKSERPTIFTTAATVYAEHHERVTGKKYQAGTADARRLRQLVQDLGAEEVARLVEYAFGHWPQLAKRFKVEGTFPGTGFLAKFGATLLPEIEAATRFANVEAEWSAWYRDHPGKSAPVDLMARYRAAKGHLS
jgi:hypothetical protein